MGSFEFGNTHTPSFAKTVELYNTAPNGDLNDMLLLTEVCNPEGGNVEWEIMSKTDDFLDPKHVGWADLTLTHVRFVSGAQLTVGQLNLLAKLMVQNERMAESLSRPEIRRDNSNLHDCDNFGMMVPGVVDRKAN
ncbi:MAG: hypothetical protein V4615_02780 [Bacteroidota bacterium]